MQLTDPPQGPFRRFALKNYISADRIKATWQKGAGDFGGATMKGTLLSDAGANLGINIKSITKTDDEMPYIFSLDGNGSLDLSKFRELDQLTTVNYCCHPEGGGGMLNTFPCAEPAQA